MGPLTKLAQALQGFATRWLLTDGTTDVVFDVTSSWNKSLPGQVAEHAVEKGVDLNDHIKRGNREIRMDILMVQEVGGLSGLFQDDPNVRADQLETWWKDGEVLTLVGKETLENILIESMSEARAAETSDARVYSLILKQVRIAETDAVSLAGAGNRDSETEESA